MESTAPDRLQLPRFFAKFFSALLATVIAWVSINAIGVPGTRYGVAVNLDVLALAGGPLLVALLGMSIYLLRKGAGWRYLGGLWSPFLLAAAIIPVFIVARIGWA